MKLSRPVHFWLIVIATAIFLLLPWTPVALYWAQYAADLITCLSYYLAFCLVVLGHAVCSANKPS